MKNLPPAVAILGMTGSGKSALAEALAKRLDCRIINADAFQVYKGFDIGTAKPSSRDRYELLDILEPAEPFSVGEFLRRAIPLLHSEWNKKQPCVVCGGTGLYVRALFEDYSELAPPAPPSLRHRLNTEVEKLGISAFAEQHGLDLEALPHPDRANPVRVVRAVERLVISKNEPRIPALPWHTRRLKFAIDVDKETLRQRLIARLDAMIVNGWIEEVRNLLLSYSLSAPAFRSIGYRQIAEVVTGKRSLEDAREEILMRTLQYARRQRTWLRKEPNLVWISGLGTIKQQVEAIDRYIHTKEG